MLQIPALLMKSIRVTVVRRKTMVVSPGIIVESILYCDGNVDLHGLNGTAMLLDIQRVLGF